MSSVPVEARTSPSRTPRFTDEGGSANPGGSLRVPESGGSRGAHPGLPGGPCSLPWTPRPWLHPWKFSRPENPLQTGPPGGQPPPESLRAGKGLGAPGLWATPQRRPCLPQFPGLAGAASPPRSEDGPAGLAVAWAAALRVLRETAGGNAGVAGLGPPPRSSSAPAGGPPRPAPVSPCPSPTPRVWGLGAAPCCPPPSAPSHPLPGVRGPLTLSGAVYLLMTSCLTGAN